jgi:hypothetical protein
MHPDVHLVRTRPPILDVPPLVWIDPPGAPKVCLPSSAPSWEWAAPQPRRSWRPAPRVALALVVTLGLVAADAPPGLEILVDEPARLQLPVPDDPIWCACVWWPSGPARPLHG